MSAAAKGSREPRSATNSTAQNTPVPRTSPMTSCLSASASRPGPSSSVPICRACSTTPYSAMAVRFATMLAAARGWPE